MASLDLEKSELKGAKMHHLSNQIHTQCAMIDKTKQNNNNKKTQLPFRERKNEGLSTDTGSQQF